MAVEEKDRQKDFNSLEDVCEFINTFCTSKSTHKDSPIMASVASCNSVGFETFWGDGRRGVWVEHESSQSNVGGVVNLHQIVGVAYSMCNYILPSYQRLCRMIEDLIVYRLDVVDDEVDGIDGADGEAYLRHMYLSLKEQGMVSANDLVYSGYYGCRQLCLYGCVCFCLLVFAMYHGDRSNMLSIDWVNHVVLDGGSAKVVTCGELGMHERLLLNSIGEMPCRKPIVNFVYDLVNTKNPSGGMIGPGNCKWFHNLVLKVTRRVDEHMEKMMKNQAVLHDACGFMLNNTDVGPGYLFGIFPHAIINVSSAGAPRSVLGRWLCSLSTFGQVSGLTTVYYLMKRLEAPFFNSYDTIDSEEHCVKDKSHLNFSSHGRLGSTEM